MSFFQEIMLGLKKATNGEPFDNAAALARACGVESNLITRWLSGQRIPKLDRLGEVLDTLGVEVSFPGEPSAVGSGQALSAFDMRLGETLAAAAELFSDNLEELAVQIYGTPKKTERLKELFGGRQRISAEECYRISKALGVSSEKVMERAMKLVADDTANADHKVA